MGYLRRIDGPHMLYAEGLGFRFKDQSLDLFRDLPVFAEGLFLELGYGYRFAFASQLPNGGDILVTPYVGARYAKLDVIVATPLRRDLEASEEWIDPVLGLLVEGPVGSGQRVEYALKLDVAGFGLGHDRYASGALYLTWRFSPRWRAGAGYRISRFHAEPGGSNDLELELLLSGPALGLAYTFGP